MVVSCRPPPPPRSFLSTSYLFPIYFLSNSYLIPIYSPQISTNADTVFVPRRVHAKLSRHRVEITLNTTRHAPCRPPSQVGTAANTKHESHVSCLRLSQHDTVRAQDFSARHAKHGTITTLAVCSAQIVIVTPAESEMCAT